MERVIEPGKVIALNKVRVTVKLFSGLEEEVKNYDPAKGMVLEIRGGVTIRDLIDSLDLPPHGQTTVVGRTLIVRPLPSCELKRTTWSKRFDRNNSVMPIKKRQSDLLIEPAPPCGTVR